MATLACDLCGGKLVMGAGGIATCDTCGMEYGVDRMREKVQELKGGSISSVPRADNSQLIANYLELATNAYDADNNEEAESYCNKIIELDPTNYKAWLLKGKAAGWQSTLQNSRVSESVSAFTKAIKNAPEEEKEDIIDQTKDQISRLAQAMISLRGKRFAKWPDEEEKSGFITDITAILECVKQFLLQAGVIIPLQELLAPMAKTINESVVKAYQDVIAPDYNGDPNDSDDRANKYEWQRYIERIGHCTDLLKQAIDLCDEDDESDIQRYENLIFLHKKAIESCSWDYEFTSWGKSWHKDWQLTDNAKSIRRNLISQYETKIAGIKKATAEKAKAEARKRNEEYWAAHAQEKEDLLAEKESLQKQIARIQDEVNAQVDVLKQEEAAIPGGDEIAALSDTIRKLKDEQGSLGLFKGKEKKALQVQIDQAEEEKKAIQSRMMAARRDIDNKINAARNNGRTRTEPLNRRISAIDTELTKQR